MAGSLAWPTSREAAARSPLTNERAKSYKAARCPSGWRALSSFQWLWGETGKAPRGKPGDGPGARNGFRTGDCEPESDGLCRGK